MVKSAAAMKRVLRPPEVRGANRAAILGLLQQNDYMSRADVARQSGLTEGAISRIVNALIEDRLIREDGAENSTGGRPGRRLALDSRRVVFGVEIQNWETRCALSTMNGRIVETKRFRTHSSAEGTLEQIGDEFIAFRKRLGSDRLPGIGISMRGIVNSDTGTLILGGRADWRQIAIREILETRLREPVFVENNVRAAALAEYMYGPSETHARHCFVFVKIDDGVGMGVLFDGRLYHGPHMAAGEFGQMIIEASNSQERDDGGCIERLIANGAICDRYSTLTGAWRQPKSGDTSARARRVAEWAVSGDAAARQSIEEAARYLGIGISNLIWGLDADTVVIDATISGAWSLMEPIVRRQLPDDSEWGARILSIRLSALGGEAALIGAATLPLSGIFKGIYSARLPMSAAR